jgi:hypothetical protein
VCSGLQAQILRCYRDHLHEVLLCSDLVKAYQHCVSTAHKVRLVCLLGTGSWGGVWGHPPALMGWSQTFYLEVSALAKGRILGSLISLATS